jgi:hypothetical protein
MFMQWQVRAEVNRFRPDTHVSLTTAMRRAAYRKLKREAIRDVCRRCLCVCVSVLCVFSVLLMHPFA